MSERWALRPRLIFDHQAQLGASVQGGPQVRIYARCGARPMHIRVRYVQLLRELQMRTDAEFLFL